MSTNRFMIKEGQPARLQLQAQPPAQRILKLYKAYTCWARGKTCAPSVPLAFKQSHLLLQRRVDARLQQEHMAGSRQVDAHAASSHAQQEHRGGRALLKGLNCLQQFVTSDECLEGSTGSAKGRLDGAAGFAWWYDGLPMIIEMEGKASLKAEQKGRTERPSGRFAVHK